MSEANPLSPDDLTLILFGHSAFQFLNAGMELGVFVYLREHPKSTVAVIADATKLSALSTRQLLFGLVALRLLVKIDNIYSNCVVIDDWFDRGQWSILEDVIRFEAYITYAGESDFSQSIRTETNVGLRHIPGNGEDLYRRLSQTPLLHKVFYDYMGSWSQMALPLFLNSVDLSQCRHVVDIGGGDATNAIALAERYPGLSVTVVDLPTNCPVAQKQIAESNLEDRIKVWPADMFHDPLPKSGDCFLFIHQMVIWSKPEIVRLLRRAHEYLPQSGQVVIFNSISSDTEDGPLMAALDSAYFISIPAPGGMIHPWKLYEECLLESGFENITRVPTNSWSPHGTILATKKSVRSMDQP
jgi:L-tyrosine C(3)-methyltransferase